MQFKDVIGQEQLKQNLIQSYQNQKVSHALLFLGSLGRGGLPLALAYSQYLNCENKQPDDSCGQCPSCVKAQKLVHPDIHFSYPFPRIDKKEKSSEFIKEWREAILGNPYLHLTEWLRKFNAENKQANIPIKECHDIIRRLSLKSFESPYKVLILWLPEYLGKEGNSLLKIIEEPPDNTVFILVAENQDKILNTIVSRTQIVKIGNIEPGALKSTLIEKFNIEEEEAFKLASISAGDYAEALNLLNNSMSEIAEQFQQWLKLCLPSKNNYRVLDLYNWIEQYANIGRENQKSFFRYALHFLAAFMHWQINNDASNLTEAELSFAKKMEQHLNMSVLQALYGHLNTSHFYLERNANPKILMMNLSIKVSKLLKQNKVILA